MAAETREMEAIIVGGGPAGLSAALYLGRARRATVVLDAGQPRHAVSSEVHNFLTRDGIPPAGLRREAWSQMATYPSVEHVDGVGVESLAWVDDRWVADAGPAGRFSAPAALLAVGVVDQHPDLPGFMACWGDTIQHCPFCHGWEMRDWPVAALFPGEAAAHIGPMLSNWTDDVIVLTDGTELDDDTRAALEAAAVPHDTRKIAALEATGSKLEAIRFDDGTALARRGMFVMADQRQTPLVRSLGLELTPFPMNRDGLVQVDVMQATSRPMLWAAGDLCTQMQQVLESAAQGGRAGAAIASTLAMRAHEAR